jgi:leucyl aminopeptidase (aminopeptidase T)
MSRHNRQLNRRHRLACFSSRTIAVAMVREAIPATASHATPPVKPCHPMCFAKGSGTCKTAASCATEISQDFVIEQCTAAGWKRVGSHSASLAKHLHQAAGEYAKATPGLKVRVIKPLPGARAAARFCWKADVVTGRWYLGSYR